MWRRKGTVYDPKHYILSAKHSGGGGIMTSVFMAANGMFCFVFIDDVTADKSSGIASCVCGQYYLLIFGQMFCN